jgi:peptide/nickel transport system substrate-binding protein
LKPIDRTFRTAVAAAFVAGAMVAGAMPGAAGAAENRALTFIQGVGGSNPIPASLVPGFLGDHQQWMFVYEALVALSADYTPDTPMLAVRWDISDDQKTYTFHLRPGVTFHDGSDFTAADVKFTYEVQNHPETRTKDTIWSTASFSALEGYQAYRSGKADHISGIEIVDDHTIRFKLTQPDSGFMLGIAASSILPHAALETIPVGDWPRVSVFEHPIGTGPYKIDKIIPGEIVHYVANDAYWGGVPKIRELYRRNIDPAVAVKGRQVDFLYTRDVALAKEAKRLGYKVISVEAPRLQVLRVTSNPPYNDPNFKLALIHAIDRDALIDAFFDGKATKVEGYMGAGFWHNKNLPERKYDPKLAKQYLAKSAYKGETFDLLYYYSDETTRDMMAAIQQYWKAVGINAVPRFIQSAESVRMIYQEKPPLANVMYAGKAYADPSWLGEYGTGEKTNYTGFANAEFDALIQKGRRVSDSAERQKIYYAAQKLIYDNVIDLPLFSPGIINIISADLDMGPIAMPGGYYPQDVKFQNWTFKK